MVVQLGIVHPPVLFFVNVKVDQADLVPQWIYWTNTVVGVEGILIFPSV